MRKRNFDIVYVGGRAYVANEAPKGEKRGPKEKPKPKSEKVYPLYTQLDALQSLNRSS